MVANRHFPHLKTLVNAYFMRFKLQIVSSVLSLSQATPSTFLPFRYIGNLNRRPLNILPSFCSSSQINTSDRKLFKNVFFSKSVNLSYSLSKNKRNYTIAKVSTQLSSVHKVDMFYLTHNLKDSRYLSLYFNTWKPDYFSIFLHVYFCTFDSKIPFTHEIIRLLQNTFQILFYLLFIGF